MKKSLGRGLSALIPDDIDEKEIQNIDLGKIYVNPNQPRKIFDEEAINSLAESIKIHGVLQPIVVKKDDNNKYMIIAGERRYKASKKANIHQIPVVIKDISMKEVMEIALIENLQRENLSPVEEGLGYKNLCENYNLTQEEISKTIGKSRSHIANMIRLLNLHEKVLFFINEKKLSAGHGKVILQINDKEKQLEISKIIIENKLSVKESEKLVQNLKYQKLENIKDKKIEKDIFIIDIEEKLRNILGTNVKISNGKKKGKIEIEYYNQDELDDIVSMLLEK